MVNRLLGILATLLVLGMLGASVASAQTVSLPRLRSHTLAFDARGVDLSGVRAARLKLGARKIPLRVGRLRTVRAVRTIVVLGVTLTAAQQGQARLLLTLSGHHGDPTAVTAAEEPHARTGIGSVSITPLGSLAAGPAIGINVGSAPQWELPFTQTLGAHNVRIDFDIDTPISEMDQVIGAYASAGIRPELLATFSGIPTTSQLTNLAAWAERYGPDGTFWAAGGYPESLAVTRIEFGNESSGPWQYPQLAGDSDWWSTPEYTQIAEQYGQAYVQAVQDISSANPGVKLLAVADSPGQAPEWLAGMFKGAPQLANVVEGWVLHPYGDDWRTDIDATLAETERLGASSTVPVYVTEVGIASDDGACLNGNYGWNACMTYEQAASTLTDQVQGIESDLGSRLAELDLFSARDTEQAGASNDMEGYFGALQSDGRPKGAFTTAVESILAGDPS